MKIFKGFIVFIKDIYKSKDLLFALAQNDFKEQFLGSYIGIFWAILRPTIFILTIWFIFSVGFKGHINSNTPFVLYLMTGYIPWFFFSDSIIGGMNSIVNNSSLVKKVNFRVSILPIIKIISVLFIHIIFIGILVIVFLLYGYKPSIYWLQLPFFIIMLFLLVLGISWFLSSLRVFTKDIAQIISVVLQLGFWVTPIFWSADMLPEKYNFILKLNPMVYIIQGYRDTFINHKWFWETFDLMQYYLIITILCLFTGAFIFRKLRPHFGDVI